MTVDLARRLSFFVDAGLLDQVPTRLQVLQGELEMWPTVISTDVTEESRYVGAPLGHPWLRQPVIFSLIGPDHLRIGTGLGAQVDSVCRHLQFTWHRGMPVWDLQVLQTHPGGLGRLEAGVEALMAGRDPRAMRRLQWILPDPQDYLRRFAGASGWIERARALDYAPSSGAVPAQFHSLVAFMAYCDRSFAAQRTDISRVRWPGHLAALATRRLREGRGFGWFGGTAS